MSDEHPAPFRRFVEDYRRVRLGEGFAATDPDFARSLPFRDTTGRNRGTWRVRALHYLAIRAALRLIPGIERVLDVGAGNGWMARRLAGRYRVTALDVDAGDTGLGGLADRRVARVRGDLEGLPLASERFDAAIAAASIHYAVDLGRALAELARVLRPGGLLVIADSPVYVDAPAQQAALERTRAYYTRAGAAHLAARYRGLTRSELDAGNRFRWLTLAPGLPSWRAAFDRIRGRPAQVRLPVLFGWRR